MASHFAEALRPDRRRQLVDDVRGTWQVSIRRACGVLRAERSSYPYRGRRADQANLKKRMKETAEMRVRYGYRRIHVRLRREGWDVKAKQIFRFYREKELQLRHKALLSCRRAAGGPGEGEAKGRSLRGGLFE